MIRVAESWMIKMGRDKKKEEWECVCVRWSREWHREEREETKMVVPKVGEKGKEQTEGWVEPRNRHSQRERVVPTNPTITPSTLRNRKLHFPLHMQIHHLLPMLFLIYSSSMCLHWHTSTFLLLTPPPPMVSLHRQPCPTPSPLSSGNLTLLPSFISLSMPKMSFLHPYQIFKYTIKMGTIQIFVCGKIHELGIDIPRHSMFTNYVTCFCDNWAIRFVLAWF